jgi:hypothetical protein
MDPFEAGTIARFEVIVPSQALRVETNGWGVAEGQSVRYPKRAGGITVAFTRYVFACGTAQDDAGKLTSMAPANGPVPVGGLVSSILHGPKVYRDRPPEAAGAK